MSEETKAPEKESGFTEQVSETLENMKEEASRLGEQLKDTAEDAWQKVKAVDVKAELHLLKEEASETIDELAGKAKGLWNKITGSDDNTSEQVKK